MALIGYEWLIVVAIVLVIFLWGPKKLPELARSIGLARKEFKKATAGEEQPDPIITAARNLGISTEGKSRQELENEIAQKTAKQ
jgi:sec-independent protein translocase protein TatA